jgi:hypothetical protein
MATKKVTLADVVKINDEALWLLRRMVKLLESSATVDPRNRQRITLDAIGATPTELAANIPITSQAGAAFIGYVGIANTAAAGFGFPVDQRYEITDRARNAYANGIRANLSWTP